MHEIKNGMTFYFFIFIFEMNAQNLKMESGAGE